MMNDTDTTLRVLNDIFAIGGRPLTKEETIEFIAKPFYMGSPRRVKPKGTVGRPSAANQYDRAYKRRNGLYAKLVRNLASSKKATAQLNKMSHHERIVFFAKGLSSKIKPAHRVTETMYRLSWHGYYPSRSTVQRVLKKHFGSHRVQPKPKYRAAGTESLTRELSKVG